MRAFKILVLLLTAAGTAWLTTLVDGGLGTGWTHDVLRNWEEFGFFNLHGKLVANPGGFEALTNPDVYAGHRAVSLYPAFILFRALGAGSAGIFVYYGLLGMMVALSIWFLLGRTERAFWLGVIGVLTPGYVRWQTTLDPNLVAVLFGFPFCAAVIALLSRPVLQAKDWAAVALVVFIFSSLNWTTVFVEAMLLVTLLVMGKVSLRRLVIFTGVTALLAGAVVIASVISKTGKPGGSGGGMSALLLSYGWGNQGYGLDLSTTTACVRLLAANIMGLLPMLIFLAWQFWRCRGWQMRGGLTFLLPALVPVVEVLGMRNYFGHHPWMSVHFILLGIILAAVAWRARTPQATVTPADSQFAPALRLTGLASAFAYAAVVLAIGYVHMEQETNLVALVRGHSSRETIVVINRATDPDLAGIGSRLPELFDRRVVVVPAASDVTTAPAPHLVVTAARPASEPVAETSSSSNGPMLNALIGWYTHYIAHRRAGDRLEIGDKYFLCQTAG